MRVAFWVANSFAVSNTVAAQDLKEARFDKRPELAEAAL